MRKLRRNLAGTPGGAPNNSDFSDRLNAAAAAKREALKRFNARPDPDDPAFKRQQAEQKAISEAREARVVERKVAREAEAARQAAEKAALAEARAVQEAAERRLAAEAAAAARRLEAERKAARDARYAARKARR